MRKFVLAAIMAAVFVSGTIVGMMPFASAVGTGGTPENHLVRQLNHVVNILARAEARLDAILSSMEPGTPSDPPTIVALDSIRSSCSSIIAKVDNALTGPP